MYQKDQLIFSGSIAIITPFDSKGGVESIGINLKELLISKDINASKYHLFDDDGKGILGLRQLINIFREYDIIHSHVYNIKYFFLFRMLSLIFNSQLVTTFHSTFGCDRFYIKRPFWKRGYRQLSLIKLLSLLCPHLFGEKIIFVSNSVRDVIRTYVSCYKIDDMVVIYNPTEITTITSETINNEVYFIGRLSVEKNPEIVIKAVLETEKIKVNILGDGPLYLPLKERYGFHDRVSFWGWTEINKQIWEKAGIVIMPSEYEGFSLTAIEAIEKNSILICSNIPSFIELKKLFNQQVFIVDVINYIKYADMLNKCIDEKIPGAKKIVAEKFSMEKFIMKTITLYKSININK